MRKSYCVLLLISFFSFITVVTAYALLENTHHDMNLIAKQADKNLCTYCHMPHGALSREGVVEQLGREEKQLGSVGAFCYICHDGTVVPTAMIESLDGTIGLDVLTKTHGYEGANIENVTGGMELLENISSSGLFGKEAGLPSIAGNFDCSACHDVHSNAYPPFLKAPLEELCTKCHSGVDRLGTGRWTTINDVGESNVSHPINMAVADSARDRVRGGGPEQRFHQPADVYRVPTRTSEELKNVNNHWEMGGHLFGVDEQVGCATCHSAHIPTKNLLVAYATDDPVIALCAGCHGDGEHHPNPGMTDGYHPVFEESIPPYLHDHATHGPYDGVPGTGTIELFVQIPEEFPISNDGTLLCRSCHITHGGVMGAKCLRVGPARWPGGVICNECHGTGTVTGTSERHHLVSPADYTIKENGGFARLTPWAWGPGLPGDLSDGLQCTDCHTKWARSAHNW